MSELTPKWLLAGANLRAFTALGAIALWSCAPQLPVGRFRCSSDADCPEDWSCAPNENGAKRCYPEGSDLNAIRNRDGSTSNPPDAGDSIESGTSDLDGSSGTGGSPVAKPKPIAGSGGASGSPAAGSGGGVSGAPAAGSGGSAGAESGIGGTTNPPTTNPDCVPDTADATHGVFVSLTGSASATCGSASDPCSTILQAMDRASELARTLIVLDSGTYPEPLTLRAGLTIRGGYARSGDTWMRNCDSNRATRSRLESSTEVGVWAEYNGMAELETLTVSTMAQAPAGHSTYGVFARGATTQLTLRDVEVHAASGGDGQTGNSGATPAPRSGTCATAGDGATGTPDGTSGTGAGAGTIDSSGYVPGDGSPGAQGQPGHNGTMLQPTCRACFEGCDTATCTGVTPTGAQSCGTPGLSGCGGAAAAGGGGGGGGGSSFGLFVWAARVTVIGGLFRTGNGGRGGVGGNPGNGGLGSDGSAGVNGPACTMCITTKGTGPIIPPPPSPDSDTEVQAAEIAAGGNAPVRPVLDGGIIIPISCIAGMGSGIGPTGGRGGAGSRGGPGGGGAGGSSYGVWAGGQASMNVSPSTKIEIGEAGVSQSSGAKGESMTTKFSNQ
jgi:hypothetical protein